MCIHYPCSHFQKWSSFGSPFQFQSPTAKAFSLLDHLWHLEHHRWRCLAPVDQLRTHCFTRVGVQRWANNLTNQTSTKDRIASIHW
jgi:hypothetical protein